MKVYEFDNDLVSDSPILTSIRCHSRSIDCQRAIIVYRARTRENDGDTAGHGAVSTLIEPPIDASHGNACEGVDADVNGDAGATVERWKRHRCFAFIDPICMLITRIKRKECCLSFCIKGEFYHSICIYT